MARDATLDLLAGADASWLGLRGASYVKMLGAQVAVEALAGTPFYATEDAAEGTEIRLRDSTALFYWTLRYFAKLVDGAPTARDRITYGEWGLLHAMDL